MSQPATRYRGWRTLRNGISETGILALLLYCAGSVGFPQLFLITSSSVVREITIANTLIFIATSGYLITIHPQPKRAAFIVGMIVLLSGTIVAGCMLIAPGLCLAIAAGIAYALAWLSLMAIFSANATARSQLYNRGNALLTQQLIWLGIGLSGVIGIVIASLKFNVWSLIFWLLFAPLIFGAVWFSFIVLTQRIKQTSHNILLAKLAPILSSIYLLIIVILGSGVSLILQPGRKGAIDWFLMIVILVFAIFTALLLFYLCVNSLPDTHFDQTTVQAVSSLKAMGLMIPMVIIFGLWGYIDHFQNGITMTERLQSLGSATLLEKTLVSHVSNQKVTVSLDDRFLSVAGENWQRNKEKVIELWNLETGQLIHTFSGYSNPLFGYSRSSQPILFMRNNDGQIAQWNLMTNQYQQPNGQDETFVQQPQIQQRPLPSYPFLPHDAAILATSRDGKTLATGFASNRRNRVLIWDIPTGRLLHSLSLPSSTDGSTVVFTSGEHLLTGYGSGNMHLWRLPGRA